MLITRDLVLKIIKYLIDNPSFYFPFKIMCKGYASYIDNDNDFVEIVPIDDYENLVEDLQYDTFELWEDLQNLDLKTIELMSKGFIEKILLEEQNTNLFNENEIKNKIIDCEKLINQLGWEIHDSEEFTLNEFLKGKVEAYNEFLQISDKTIKDFIFITFEGMTFKPNSESDIPDIENMQVIGFEKGFNVNEAFKNLKLNLEYLKDTSFDEIIGIELKSKEFHYFNLN